MDDNELHSTYASQKIHHSQKTGIGFNAGLLVVAPILRSTGITALQADSFSMRPSIICELIGPKLVKA